MRKPWAGSGERGKDSTSRVNRRSIPCTWQPSADAWLWAGGRPRLITDDDQQQFIVATATTRPKALGRPFTHWSVRKLADYLATNRLRRVVIGWERLRQILRHQDVSLQRTRTWEESRDPDKAAKLDRIEPRPKEYLGRGRRTSDQ